MTGPLDGLRVIDLTAALAGPAATQRLGDWGADIIKIENPRNGEWTRTHPVANAWLDDETTVFLSLNRNKRSVGLDLKDDGDRETLLQLVENADIFVHNFRPGVVERLGLTPDIVRGRNDSLIYAFVSGYGTQGPDAFRPGQDLLLQAYSGVMFSVGAEGDRPQPGPVFAADVIGSHVLAEGILTAIIERGTTGHGQVVEISMLGGMLDAQLQELVTFLNRGIAPERGPSPVGHALLNPPYGTFQTKDGWIALAMPPPAALGAAIGSEEVSELETWENAAKQRDLIFAEVERLLPERTTAEWIECFDAYGVWSGPVHHYEDLPAVEHIHAEGYFADIPLPSGGTFRCPDKAVRFSNHPHPKQTAPPRLGQHNTEVLDTLQATKSPEPTTNSNEAKA
jgi:crotonobetainyl-CoA:carnitine CoA-transferase CaiB-like acyl-CoA transferase